MKKHFYLFLMLIFLFPFYADAYTLDKANSALDCLDDEINIAAVNPYSLSGYFNENNEEYFTKNLINLYLLKNNNDTLSKVFNHGTNNGIEYYYELTNNARNLLVKVQCDGQDCPSLYIEKNITLNYQELDVTELDNTKKITDSFESVYRLAGMNSIDALYHYGYLYDDNMSTILARYPELNTIMEQYPEYDYEIIIDRGDVLPGFEEAYIYVGVFKNNILYSYKEILLYSDMIIFVDKDNDGTIVERATEQLDVYFNGGITFSFKNMEDYNEMIPTIQTGDDYKYFWEYQIYNLIGGDINFNGKKYGILIAETDTILKKNINTLAMSMINAYYYTGSVIKPEITIEDNEYILVENIDYELQFNDEINIGEYSVKIIGKGSYYGTKIETYTIYKANIDYDTGNASLYYNGQQQGINITIRSPGVTVKYADENGNYVLDEMPKYINAGTYEIYYELSGNNYNTVTGNATLVIKPINFNYSQCKVENHTVAYDGQEHAFRIKCDSEMVKIKYLPQGYNDYIEEPPRYVNSGVYRIDYLLYVENPNYSNRVASYKEFSINKAYLSDVTKNKTITYDGKEYSIDVELKRIQDETLYDIDSADITIKYADSNGEYILDESPKYANAGVYRIAYKVSGANYQELVNYAMLTINKADFIDNTKNQTITYDGQEHQLSLDISGTGLTIKYANIDGKYVLNDIPKYKDVGTYTIKYQVTSSNYNNYVGEKTLTIQGIQNIDSTLKIESNCLLIKDGINSVKTLQDRFKINATSYKWKHFDSGKMETNDDLLKTGDYIQLIVDDMKINEYQISIHGDLTGDGRTNSADLLQMRKYLLEEVKLNGVYKLAGIIESDNEIKSLDLLRLRQYLLGEYTFK